jgi:hypothetical protein
MNKNSRPNASVVLIQIQGTELHIDKEGGWKVTEGKDLDDILMRAITQLLDHP